MGIKKCNITLIKKLTYLSDKMQPKEERKELGLKYILKNFGDIRSFSIKKRLKIYKHRILYSCLQILIHIKIQQNSSKIGPPYSAVKEYNNTAVSHRNQLYCNYDSTVHFSVLTW